MQVLYGEFVWLQGERQGGFTKVQTNPRIKVSVQNYPGELHVPCISTSLHLSLSL